ncbi:MAG: HAMP domain-containing histidine kinase [Nitrospirae bacterium]|nr:HAMP domain-containing histidine kinase [Nitrospirota bacterium]
MKEEFPIRKSLRWQLLSTMIGLIVSLLVILTFIQFFGQRKMLKVELKKHIALIKKNLRERVKSISINLRTQMEESLATYNFSNISILARNAVSEDNDISYVILMDSAGVALVRMLRPDLQASRFSAPDNVFNENPAAEAFREYEKDGKQRMEFIVALHVSNKTWGILRIGISLENLNKVVMEAEQNINNQTRELITRSFLILILFVASGTIIALVLASRLTKPLVGLTRVARELAKGNFSAANTLTFQSAGELEILSRSFTEMSGKLKDSYEKLEDYSHTLEQKVEDRTKELKDAMAELNKVLEDLQESQEQLIQAEKMASLGQLVAGVAHEINTPVGVSVTAASHLVLETKKIISVFEARVAKKADMEEYFNTALESSDLILRNLNRTSALIKSFKMVSADQTSQDYRTFKIKDYLDDIIISLQPKLRKTGHTITIACPDGLEISSYPGAFAQVITNLVINSMMHAFATGVNGLMTIKVTEDPYSITLRFSDNGKGIAEENLGKIFDPFFTTKRGAGGTGLGLHIVFNIVNQTLKGSIKCESSPGHGTTFILSIPR